MLIRREVCLKSPSALLAPPPPPPRRWAAAVVVGGKREVPLSLLPLLGDETLELVEEKVEWDMEWMLLRSPLLTTLALSISSGDFSERKLEYPLDGVGLCRERLTIVMKSPLLALWWALLGVSPGMSGLEVGLVLLLVATEEGVW